MSKFETLTNKIVEKSPSKAKAKGNRLRKGRQSDDGRTSSEPSSDSEGEFEEQIRQRKKNKKKYDFWVSLPADHDSEPAGNLNKILEINKESEDEDSDSGLKGLIQELDKDEEIGEKINKNLTYIANKVWQNPNAFEIFKTKIKTYKTPQNYSDLLVKEWNKEIWQKRMNAQDRKKRPGSVESCKGQFLKEYLPFVKSQIP